MRDFTCLDIQGLFTLFPLSCLHGMGVSMRECNFPLKSCQRFSTSLVSAPSSNTGLGFSVMSYMCCSCFPLPLEKRVPFSHERLHLFGYPRLNLFTLFPISCLDGMYVSMRECNFLLKSCQRFSTSLVSAPSSNTVLKSLSSVFMVS